MSSQAGADEQPSAADYEAVRNCLARVARGLDRRDRALLESAFWPDAEINVGSSATAPDFIDWVLPLLANLEMTHHFLGQSLIEIKGGTAAAETYLQAYHRIMIGDALRDIVLCGRYVDRFEKRDGEWRIGFRHLLADYFQENPSPPGIWASFSMGPLPEANIGVCNGVDASADLLAGRKAG